MMVGYKKLGMVLGAVAVLALLPARADAQFVRYSPVFWAIEGNGGITLPMGDLGDVADPGLTFGLAGSYFLNPRFALRVEGGLSFLGAADGSQGGVDPDLSMWGFTGGFEYHITDPTSSTFFTFDLGAGGVTFDTDVFTVNDVDCSSPSGCSPSTGAQSRGNFDRTYFALNGGLQLGYNFARHGATGTPMGTIFIGADIYLVFADAVDSSLISALYGNTSGFDTAYAIPITGGLRLNIP
jgi:hypothetical protein